MIRWEITRNENISVILCKTWCGIYTFNMSSDNGHRYEFTVAQFDHFFRITQQKAIIKVTVPMLRQCPSIWPLWCRFDLFRISLSEKKNVTCNYFYEHYLMHRKKVIQGSSLNDFVSLLHFCIKKTEDIVFENWDNRY